MTLHPCGTCARRLPPDPQNPYYDPYGWCFKRKAMVHADEDWDKDDGCW